MQRKPRRIEAADFARLRTALDLWAAVPTDNDPRAKAAQIVGVRTRAIVVLAHASALTLSETLDLRLADLLNMTQRRNPTTYGRWTVTAPWQFRVGRHLAVLPEQAREPLQAWIRFAALHNHLNWPPARTTPLFHDATTSRPRALIARTVQDHFATAQRLAGLAARYRFSDLRYDSLCALASRTSSLGTIRAFGRLSDDRSALRFLPRTRAPALLELAELAQRDR